MRNGIREFQPRQPLDRQLGATTLNQILRELESLRITRVVNGTFRKLPGGTEITVAPQRGGGTSTPTARQPWDLIARVDPDADPEDENPPYLVSVQPGTLNGFLPTNWNTEGGGKDVVCQSDGTLYYAKAIVATDGQAMTSVTIEIDENAPDPQEPQEFGIANPVEYLFGLFLEGTVYRVIGDGHIDISPKLWLTTEKELPAASGEIPFRQFFALR
jgi:hypothetical protein